MVSQKVLTVTVHIYTTLIWYDMEPYDMIIRYDHIKFANISSVSKWRKTSATVSRFFFVFLSARCWYSRRSCRTWCLHLHKKRSWAVTSTCGCWTLQNQCWCEWCFASHTCCSAWAQKSSAGRCFFFTGEYWHDHLDHPKSSARVSVQYGYFWFHNIFIHFPFLFRTIAP